MKEGRDGKGAALEIAEFENLPSLVMFDLDYCLWPFWCEMYSEGDMASLYPESRAVLEALRSAGVKMALASRTPTPNVARAFLRQLELDDFFWNVQLVPAVDGFDQQSAPKDTCHFPNIAKASGIRFSDMLFFDDEEKNVRKVAGLGVTAMLVSTATGMTMQALSNGLRLHADTKSQSQRTT